MRYTPLALLPPRRGEDKGEGELRWRVDTVREQTVQVNGMRIFYREDGAGEPILLLHGVPTSSYLWRKLMPRLARFGRAVAPDHYGFGRSDKPADADYSVPGYVRYLEGFTTALGLDRLHLIVHETAERFHRDLEGSSLVLLGDAGHLVPEDKPEEVGQLIESFYARRPWGT